MTSLRLPLLLLVLILPASTSAQVTIEGKVTDGAGVPVADADLDFFESGSRAKVDPSAPGFESQSDKTDIFGEYEMVVIPEVYDVRYEPPANRPDLAPIFVREIILGTDRVQDVTLPEGSRLGGTLRDPDGAPVAGADLDVRDPDTGTKIATVRDDTDADGRFDTTVIRGEWDVVFRPPVGSGAGPLRLERVDLNSDLETDVTLPRGFTLTGVVQRGDGSRVRGADLDFENVETARRVPTSDDATDTDGSFRINVPEGALHVFITPPPGQGLAPSAIWDVGMDADLDLGTLTLTSGVLVEGVVTDPSGMPIAGADLDLWVAGTCRRFPAAGADTDTAGRYSLRVQAGSYDVVVNPPVGTGLPTRRFDSQDLSTDSDLDLSLSSGASDADEISARVQDDRGVPVEGATVRGTPLSAGAAWESVTGPDGIFAATAPPGRYRIDVLPTVESDLRSIRIDPVDLPCGLAAVIPLPDAPPAPELVDPGLMWGFPNPWRAETKVALELPASAPDATVMVYDVTGRRLRELHRGPLPPGRTEFPWDGRDRRGRPVPAGIYFVRLESAAAAGTAKIARVGS